MSILRDHEAGSAVENRTRGSSRGRAANRRDGYYERLWFSVAVVNGGETRIVVRNPERAGGTEADSPGIDEIGISVGSNPRLVRGQKCRFVRCSICQAGSANYN